MFDELDQDDQDFYFAEENFNREEDDVEYCDVCGAELDVEDYAIHLCKICQNNDQKGELWKKEKFII